MRPESLEKLVADFPFEAHDIARQLDATGRYALPFQREFPLSVRLFRYEAECFTQGPTWHEQLEIFCPVEGEIEIQMGVRVLSLKAGDVLIVDHQRLHHVLNRPDLKARVAVVSFLPELVSSLGSLSHDFEFLLPFYNQLELKPHVLRADEPAAVPVHEALSVLVREFFAAEPDHYREAACKARLLNLLLLLLRRFQHLGVLRWQFEKRRQLACRFGKLLNHLHQPEAERLSLTAAASLCGMSVTQFSRLFKQVSGMTYVGYLTHLRLTEAARLLREGQLSIAEIADMTGFADQSHFDRYFKRAFARTPKEFQRRASGGGKVIK
ncbi:MAG: AraC family transcriptional regulator [Verrucomicrobiota bacterium]